MKRWLAVLLILLMLPLPRARAEEIRGKTLSVLGDSISTYEGYSDNGAFNETIEGYRLFYPQWGNSVRAADTWWYQAAEILDLRLLVNNSFSGSCLLRSAHGAEGAYIDRCVQLHSREEDPDIIALYLGTNDYYGYPETLGTFDGIDFDALILPEGYAQPQTTMEAYAITLHKMKNRYPDAKIYCFTLLPLANSILQPEAFNADILRLAEYFDCAGVDLYRCGIVPQIHMGDALHPEKAGMDAITAAFVAAILEQESRGFRVNYDLTDTASTGGTATRIPEGGMFATELIAQSAAPYLAVTVTMDGVDITPYCLKDNRITVARVTGDLTVTATPVTQPPAVAEADLRRVIGGFLLGGYAIVK